MFIGVMAFAAGGAALCIVKMFSNINNATVWSEWFWRLCVINILIGTATLVQVGST